MRLAGPILALAAASALSGCASFGSVVRERGGRAALCHVADADDARLVIPGVLAEARLAWRVRYVVRRDVPTLGDRAAAALFDRYVVAIVDLRIGDQQEDKSSSASLVWPSETFFKIAPHSTASTRFSGFGGQKRVRVDPVILTYLTGEPSPRSISVNGTAYPPGALARAMLTLGGSLLFEKTRPTTTSVPDPNYHFEEEAPLAAELQKALHAALPDAEVVLIPRTGPRQKAKIEAELSVSASESDTCSAEVKATVASPDLTLGEPVTDPDAFHPFATTSWRGASVETDRRYWIYRSKHEVAVPDHAAP